MADYVLDQLIDQTERIGVIGSPSSTSELGLDILGSAVNRKLVGELALFRFLQDGKSHYALGQITEVTLRNVWHEDPTMRSLIRQRGRVDAVSERQDTHQGEMTVSAVFCRDGSNYRPSILGTVPATSTPIHLVDDRVLETLLAPYRTQLFYLGRVYGSTPKLPLWFKHFDSGPDGAGEAYHLGIFGKTGSGKSVLAKMILLAYARYPQMALLVLDPQGEFAKDLRREPTGAFRLPMTSVLKRLHKPAQVIGVRDLVLDRWELFEQILYESPFFEQLSVPKGENRNLACKTLADRLKEREKVRLSDLHSRDAFNTAWRLLGDEQVQKVFYRSEESRKRFQSMYQSANPDEFYTRYWKPVAWLFREDRKDAQKVDTLLYRLLIPQEGVRPLLVIDLSAEQIQQVGAHLSDLPMFKNLGGIEDQEPVIFWTETTQALVVKRLLEGIQRAAEAAYRENRSLNTLVLMDEAHRLAPREDPENPEKKAIRDLLIDAARTTRKYGVGWMFISQTLSSLHRGIVDQLRIFFFGFGLGMGQEFRALSELAGGRGKALDLYQSFRDPHSAFDPTSREYSFMTL